jgi:hypothetical protein
MASTQTAQLLNDLNNSGLQTSNPPVYNAILGLIQTVDGLSTDLQTQINLLAPGGVGVIPNNVTGFIAIFTNANVILSWDSQGAGFSYEIRLGSVWQTSTYITTTIASSIPLNPPLVGTYTYLIKVIGPTGNFSTTAIPVTFTIPALGPISLTATNLSNNLLFSWNAPSSTFIIDHYIFTRNGTVIGTVNSTFFVYQELVAGTYTYSVQAVDIAGNITPLTAGSTIVMTIPAPQNFTSSGTITDTTFNGTKTNCITEGSPTKLLAPVNSTETWTDHFVNNSWTKIQDQITAGYPIYIQPNKNTATYVKIFDFGSSFANQIINITYSTNIITAAVALGFVIAWSPDNITYTSIPAGTGAFISNTFRYIKVTITFTPTLTTSLIELTNLTVNLSTSISMDSGVASAVSTDAGGTVVAFSKTFLVPPAIVFTTQSPQPIYPVFQSVTTTQFQILVFDSSGNRISATVGWHARGLL